jgi:hypothetical protein
MTREAVFHRDAGGLATVDLDLPAVQPRPDLEPDVTDAFGDCARASDRRPGALEDREEPVARRVHLAAAEPPQFAADDRVVSADEFPPAAIAELGRDVCRADDVRE